MGLTEQKHELLDGVSYPLFSVSLLLVRERQQTTKSSGEPHLTKKGTDENQIASCDHHGIVAHRRKLHNTSPRGRPGPRTPGWPGRARSNRAEGRKLADVGDIF